MCSIQATVEVKAGSAILATARRELALLDQLPIAKGQKQAGPVVIADPKVVPVQPEIRLPGPIDDIAVGGDRYLVIACRNPAKLVIFDAGGRCDLEGDLAHRQGNRRSREQVVRRRLSGSRDVPNLGLRYHDCEEGEFPSSLSAKARIEGIAMGSETEGPLLVIWDIKIPRTTATTSTRKTPSLNSIRGCVPS